MSFIISFIFSLLKSTFLKFKCIVWVVWRWIALMLCLSKTIWRLCVAMQGFKNVLAMASDFQTQVTSWPWSTSDIDPPVTMITSDYDPPVTMIHQWPWSKHNHDPPVIMIHQWPWSTSDHDPNVTMIQT